MYMTRPISHYRSYPEFLSLPPDGPNSGYLVIQDIEPEEIVTCFILSQGYNRLPFPQNINLTTKYHSGENTYHAHYAFFPVLNQPLSANQYYVINTHKRDKGKAYCCSKEEDVFTCCFCRNVADVEPRPLDPDNIYLQFEIVDDASERSFYAKSVAHNGVPPWLLRRGGWTVQTKNSSLTKYILGEALGLDTALRGRLPDLSFPLSRMSSEAVVIGKWYCPFMFIRDGTLTARDQMENSRFYKMTLEQRWEQIFECDNNDHSNVVMVDAVVQKEVVLVGDREAVWDEKNVVDKTIRFTSFGTTGEEVSVGLRLEIVERMKWEEERGGWLCGDERVVTVDKVEEFRGGAEGWRKLRCYVLVERFVLKRMDGSLVMTYDFKHTHELNCTWE